MNEESKQGWDEYPRKMFHLETSEYPGQLMPGLDLEFPTYQPAWGLYGIPYPFLE